MHIRDLCKEAHRIAVLKGFWATEKGISSNTQLDKEIVRNSCKIERRNDGELIALMHSELSEALEALRNSDSSKNNVGEELADCCIRIFDYCEARDIDLEKEIIKKMDKNKIRPYKHGKKF